MSLSSVQVAITPAAGSIPACKPNLMPFHINYNGPAAVSAFMHVEKLVDSFESAEAHGFELQTDNSPADAGSPPTLDVSGKTQSLHATTSSDASPSLIRSTTKSTLVSEASSTIMERPLSSSPSFSEIPPPIEELDKRFISTFRGRSIHGLTIDLPDGYGGVVLKSMNNQAGIVPIATGDGRKDADADLDLEPRGKRRRGRLRSSAAPRKGTVVTILDDDDPVQDSAALPNDGNDIEMAEPLSMLNGPKRILVPTSRFDSFTLWQADRMVNKSNDGYWRTLTEWIGLAHEIHSV